jgi:hypothetical protein
MLETLKRKLKENEQPVGTKKYSTWKLPPPNFSYGYPVVPDKEGVSISKKKKIKKKKKKKK